MKAVAGMLLLAVAALAQTDVDTLRHKLADWPGLNVYGSEDSELPPPKPGENRVVIIGDDLTAAFPKSDRWINRGIRGQVSAQMLVRFRQDVVNLQAKVVIIQAGLNDVGMVMGPGTESTIGENLRSMIDIAKANGIRVILASITPVCNCYSNQTTQRPVGRISAINASLRALAKETGSGYLDLWTALADPATKEMKKDFTADGVWPNASGYAKLTPVIEAQLK